MPGEVRVAIVLPRHMRFSPHGATSIDLVAHDLAVFSRFADTTVVVAEAIADPFDDIPVVPFARHAWEPHALLGWRLGRLVRARGADIVVVHQHLPTAVALAAAVRPVPVLLHAHGWPKPPRGGVDRWRRGSELARMAGVVLVSRACRDAFRAAWGEVPPAHAIPNALDLAAWEPVAVREPVVVLAARLSPEKAVLETAEALARALPDLDGWRAIVFGAMADRQPDYARAVETALAPLGERAELRLGRPHAEVQAAFERAAIALAPSNAMEAFGRAALEAFAGGAALIASPVGGMAEVIGDAAVALDSTAPAAIAEAVASLARDEPRRAELAARGLERARLYDIRTAAQAYDKLLESTALRRGRTAVASAPVAG